MLEGFSGKTQKYEIDFGNLFWRTDNKVLGCNSLVTLPYLTGNITLGLKKQQARGSFFKAAQAGGQTWNLFDTRLFSP